MNIIVVLLPLALILSFAFLGAFIWAATHGQYDDLETPAHRILIDDDDAVERTKTT